MLNTVVKPVLTRAVNPLARALLRLGVTPNFVTVGGTVASIVAALWLFPSNQLFWGTMVIWFFVMFDMLDGTMARAHGGGTRFGAVLDASCDRIADGVIFGSLIWWVLDHDGADRLKLASLLVILVCSQVISYIKARGEASGLDAGGGLIERPERLTIILVGTGLTGLGLTWALSVAIWILLVGSIITVGQRLYRVSASPGARDKLPLPATAGAAGPKGTQPPAAPTAEGGRA